MASRASGARFRPSLTSSPSASTPISVDQIDVIAKQSGVSLFRLRLTEAEVDRLLNLDGARRQSYLLNVLSVEDR